MPIPCEYGRVMILPRAPCSALRPLFFAIALVSLAIVFACGASPTGANRPLPSYAGHALELFDDAIEPRSVGLEMDQPSDPRTDALLRERAQLSDAAMRVRVTTVTEKSHGADAVFQLGVRTLELIGGPFPPPDDFVVTVRPRTPSIGIVRNLESAIVGKTFVAFVRAFVLPDGDRELHFHFAADAEPEIAAVREATKKNEH
jgi:hypothetical protein